MVRVPIALAALATLGSASPAADDAVLDLRPAAADGVATAIDVRLTLARGPAAMTLSAPVVYPGAPGVADRIGDLALVDARGAVPLAVSEDAAVPGGFPYYRHWTAGRPVSYPVTLRYRARVQPAGGPGGPPFGIRAVAGGFAGAGSGFLLLPDGMTARTTRVRWDLSALPAGSLASTSMGDGPDFRYTGGPDALVQSWILAGPAGRYPRTGAAEGFSATWLGKPVWDAGATMAFAARGHAYLARYFPHLKPTPPYRVFLQFRDQPPFGGATALTRSFMLSRGPLAPGETPQPPNGTLFHEMIHEWVGGIDAPAGVSSWFSEGLTTYYEHLLPLRGGFATAPAFGAEINQLAREYFTSKARNWSAQRVTQVGFADEEVRHTPYRRSAMYFYDLDSRIRARSGGRRNLDSLLFPMFVAREKGARFDNPRWIAMVTAELGPEEKGRFERLILEGTDTLDPRSDMFGPCFARQATTWRVRDALVAGFEWVRVPAVPDRACAAR